MASSAAVEEADALVVEPVERRREDRRRAQVPVAVDRRRTDRRTAVRLEPPTGAAAGAAIVVDEWPLVRAGVVQVLDELGLRTAVAGASAGDALRDAEGKEAVLAVLGLHHDLPRVEAARALKGREVAPQVVVLLDRTDAGELKALLAAGVDGLLLRSVAQEELRAAAERVIAGHRVLAGPVLSLLATAGLDLAAPPAVVPQRGAAHLTGKELEVLQGLARGDSTRTIAEALHVSAATVKTHLSHLYAKLGVDSRQRAIVVAVERGLLR